MPKQSENKKDGSWTSDHKFTVCRFLLQKRQAGPPPASYLLTPYTPLHPSQSFLSFTQFNIFYIPFFLTLPFFYSIQCISFSILPNPSFLLSNSIYIIFHPSHPFLSFIQFNIYYFPPSCPHTPVPSLPPSSTLLSSNPNLSSLFL